VFYHLHFIPGDKEVIVCSLRVLSDQCLLRSSWYVVHLEDAKPLMQFYSGMILKLETAWLS